MLKKESEKKRMKYIIFSFEEGDYLSDASGKLLVFDSQGLAFQYLQKHYHQPLPKHKTKKVTNYPKYYKAPFKCHKVC